MGLDVVFRAGIGAVSVFEIPVFRCHDVEFQKIWNSFLGSMCGIVMMQLVHLYAKVVDRLSAQLAGCCFPVSGMHHPRVGWLRNLSCFCT